LKKKLQQDKRTHSLVLDCNNVKRYEWLFSFWVLGGFIVVT